MLWVIVIGMIVLVLVAAAVLATWIVHGSPVAASKNVQITDIKPRGCCDPESFVLGGRRTTGTSRPAPTEGWPKYEFEYIYRCLACGQRWEVTYHPPGRQGDSGYFNSSRDGGPSWRYRRRLAQELLRQGTT